MRFYHIIKPQFSTKVLKQNVHMVVLTQSELYRQITSIPANLSNEKCQQKRTANSTTHSSSLINITCIGSNHPNFQNFQGKKCLLVLPIWLLFGCFADQCHSLKEQKKILFRYASLLFFKIIFRDQFKCMRLTADLFVGFCGACLLIRSDLI